MRHPNLHKFLVWAGGIFIGSPIALLGLVAALAQAFPERSKPWFEKQFDMWWPVMTAWWFVLMLVLFSLAYIAALIYTGTSKGQHMKEDGKDENRQVPASEGMVIRNCLVDTVSQDGLVAGGKVRIHGFKSINNGGAGIRLERDTEADLSDIECRDNKGDGLAIGGGDGKKPE